MGGSIQRRTWGLSYPPRELLVSFTLACLSCFQSQSRSTLAAALIVNPRHSFLFKDSGLAKAFPTPRLRTDTKLKNKHDNNISDDDFASFHDFEEEDQAQLLAREFYEELEYRQNQSSEPIPEQYNDETYTDRIRGETDPNKDASINTIRTTRIRAADGSNPPSSPRSRQLFTNQQPAAPPPRDFPFFSFLAPPSRPSPSAGLFSGKGMTVYSSGRNIRAEIEILETAIKHSEAKKRKPWDDIYIASPEQMEEIIRLVALSLVVASVAYIAIEASGGMAVISFDSAAASADHVVSLMGDATKDILSSTMVSVRNGDVFMGEEAAWLTKESSELAAQVVQAVHFVEELAVL